MPRKKVDPANEAPPGAVELSDIEKSAIGEVCDLITASLLKVFGEKLGTTLGMDASEVNVISVDALGSCVDAPVLLVQLNCTQAIEGQFFLFISGEGLPSIFDLAIPDNAKEVGAEDEVILEGLKEIIGAAISEAMANFAASMGYIIDCAVVDTIVLQDEAGLESICFLYPEGELLSVVTTLALSDSSVKTGYLLPVSLSGQIIELLLNEQAPAVDSSVSVDDSTIALSETELQQPTLTEQEINDVMASAVVQPVQIRQPVHDVQPASFGSLGDVVDTGGVSLNSNISLLLDVMLDASIELGKTTMTIEEILRLGKGSVIELDKLASEPVEFLVNGKVIARGEVVVIDDNFGIRITEILSPRARLESI